jgi:hypothetical protein
MEVMVAVQSGTLLRALRVQLKRRVSARRGGDYNEVPQATQKKSRPSPSNCVTPFACKLTLDFGPLPSVAFMGTRGLEHVHLISFLDLVCVALLFITTG